MVSQQQQQQQPQPQSLPFEQIDWNPTVAYADIDYCTLIPGIPKLDLAHLDDTIEGVRAIKHVWTWPFFANFKKPEYYNNLILSAEQNKLFTANNDNTDYETSSISSSASLSPITPQLAPTPLARVLEMRKQARVRSRRRRYGNKMKNNNNKNNNKNNDDKPKQIPRQRNINNNPYIGHPSTAKVLAEINQLKMSKNL
mmetsp:Transcript_20633/g.18217  ORF Transcript_20633/g.18217 Transcript_20633/m.18217 type:complete len:198 (+) Transcript_20633:1-594(+)|eukprot:CAMPEP_0201574726 /NCGR_PEP_ID=MMETSP0190_2-20130828/19416_1 /ASSEMBLY_ACC=CAM_ASM_000263 /TAXON_ID=37353 /ORGANISM="Rosalina sp." /LENGTH=197 /DNA_ID=CAMNT_0048003389 /DNA_START=1 /DNA_END=594 /DNA_ORIENTATION=-